MQRFYETVIDTLTGAAVSGAQVFVFDTGGNIVPIWQNAGGTIVQSNPIITDDNGFFAFYIADGTYNFDYRSGGFSLREVEGVAIFDLADMRSDLNAVVTAEATEEAARAAAVTAEATTRAAAVTAEATTRASADTTLANAIAALDADTYSKGETDAAIAAVARYYAFGSFAVANILASEVLLDHEVVVPCTLAANFANAQVSVGTPPAATWTATVKKNGATIGTIAIDNTGAVTKATTGGTAKALVAGDVVTVEGDAVAQAAMARLRFTFRGTI